MPEYLTIDVKATQNEADVRLAERVLAGFTGNIIRTNIAVWDATTLPAHKGVHNTVTDADGEIWVVIAQKP